MQLIINIKNESMVDKIKAILNVFKNDGVEIQQTTSSEAKTSEQKPETDLTDAYMKEHWRELIMTTHSDPDYYKSEQYKLDRAIDYEERHK